MDDDGPSASTSRPAPSVDLFAAFYEPLRLASRSKGEEQLDHLDGETGLAVSWQDAIAGRLEAAASGRRQDGMVDENDGELLELDDEEKQSFMLEANTWSLLQALYLERTAPPPASSSGHTFDPSSSTPFPYTPPLTLVQSAIASDPSLSELSVVKDWLCSTAYGDLHPAEVRKGYLPYTKNKLKQSLRTANDSSKKGNLVDSLDPDATNRTSSDNASGSGRKVLDSEDVNYEKALLRTLWEYVRVGELDQAVDMCRQSDCSWRAASLSGGKLYEDDILARAAASGLEGEDMEVLQYEAEERVLQGNLRRKLWKTMCRSLSSTTHLDQYEKALYGAVSGEVDTVLPVAKNWEDHLWIRVNGLLEEQIDSILAKKEGEGNYLLSSSSSNGTLGSDSSSLERSEKGKKANIPQAMQEIFNTLLAEPKLRIEARSPFHVAQSWIILNRTNDLLNSFVGKLEATAGELDEPQLAHLLRFFAHLILFLRLISTSSSNPSAIPELPSSSSSAILEAYIQVLQAHSKPASIIAFYCSSLDSAQAIESYSRYLHSEYTSSTALTADGRSIKNIDRSERRKALLFARENGLDLASTARRVVELTLADVYAELPDFDAATAAFGLLAPGEQMGSDREQELVRSVEWLTFDGETYPDALRQANALMRYFLCAGSPLLARRITFQIPPDLLSTSALNDAISPAENQIAEYLDYNSFFSCLSLHIQFTEVWSRRPPPNANKSDKMAFAQGLKGLTDNLWEEVVDLLSTGWLVQPIDDQEVSDLDAQRRQMEMQRIRSAYIPELIFRLHNALLDTGRDFVPSNLHRALELSNIVADEKHRLYIEFMGDGHSAGQSENRLKEYLGMVREASLAALERSNDPFVVVEA